MVEKESKNGFLIAKNNLEELRDALKNRIDPTMSQTEIYECVLELGEINHAIEMTELSMKVYEKYTAKYLKEKKGE